MRRPAAALLVMCLACAPTRPAATGATMPGDPWAAQPRRASAKTLEIASLALATGVTASAFGGGLAGAGHAVGPPSGEPPFWIGVCTLAVGITATTVGLVVLAIAGVQYATGD